MKKFERKIDKIFYFIVMLAPFIVLAFYTLKGETITFFEQITGIFQGTKIYDTLAEVFGENGIAPFFTNRIAVIMDFITYIVYVSIAHLIIDVIKFLPDFCHKLLSKCNGADE